MEQEGTKATAWLNLGKAMPSNGKLTQNPPMAHSCEASRTGKSAEDR